MRAACPFSRRPLLRWWRSGFGLLLALWVWAQCLPAVAVELERARFLALAGSILKVEALKAGGGYSLGTGVSVAAGKFVTNCHVTRDAATVMLVYGGARWPATAELADSFLDLCVLDVPGLKDVPPVPLASARDLALGQAVVAMGFTGGLGMQHQAGVISGLHDLYGSKVVQTTTAFTSGASGGALFNSQGQLVGVLTFRLRGADGYYFSSPIDWIAARVGNADDYVKVGPLRGDAAFWAQAVDALPYFMQAASLEADGKWAELLRLTERWSGAEEHNPEPWFLRGNSYVKLDRVEGAVKAYRKAVTLDPAFGKAWFNLGTSYLRLGEPDEVQRVLTVLRGVDADLAAELTARSASPRRQEIRPMSTSP